MRAIVALLAVGALSGFAQEPSRFYIVTDVFSDAAPFWFHYILDVKMEGTDTMVRYIRVAPLNHWCAGVVTVKAVEARLKNMTPSGIVGRTNPCRTDQRRLEQALLRPSKTRVSVFDTASWGIVAQCSGKERVLSLPIPEEAHLDRLKRSDSDLARLWSLVHEVVTRAFGEKSMFYDIPKDQDLELQRKAEGVVPDLLSGKYDRGLSAACSGGVLGCRDKGFSDDLKGYRGVVADARPVGNLENRDTYRFFRFEDPTYPVLAQQARIQGEVELQLDLDRETGAVVRASSLSGHKLLQPAAEAGAKQWRFDPSSLTSDAVKVVVNYSLDCPIGKQ
jgi:hypothetical protein